MSLKYTLPLQKVLLKILFVLQVFGLWDRFQLFFLHCTTHSVFCPFHGFFLLHIEFSTWIQTRFLLKLPAHRQKLWPEETNFSCRTKNCCHAIHLLQLLRSQLRFIYWNTWKSFTIVTIKWKSTLRGFLCSPTDVWTKHICWNDSAPRGVPSHCVLCRMTGLDEKWKSLSTQNQGAGVIAETQTVCLKVVHFLGKTLNQLKLPPCSDLQAFRWKAEYFKH